MHTAVLNEPVLVHSDDLAKKLLGFPAISLVSEMKYRNGHCK